MLQYHQRGHQETTKVGIKNGIGSLEVVKVLEQLPNDSKLVRFFERDGGYEVYGEGAIKVAGLLFRTANLSSIAGGLPVLNVTPLQFSTVAQELLKEHRVEVWNFNSARRSWKVSVRASPGNFEQIEALLSSTSDETINENCCPIIASVFLRLVEGERRVGLAVADVTKFSLGWCTFVDSELLSNLEGALVQLNVKECIFPENSIDIAGILETSSSSTFGTPLPSMEFEFESLHNDLSRLLIKGNSGLMEEDIPLESQSALAGLVKYLDLLTSDSNLGIFTLNALNLAQYMRLDETALKTLNIFPGVTGGKNASLFGILDHCKTRQGSRLLAQWLRQPLLEQSLIEERLDVVEALAKNSIQRQMLRENVLRGIVDISRIVRKLVKGKANLQDLVVLYVAVGKISLIHEQLISIVDAPKALEETLIGPLQQLSFSLTKYAELIEGTVDFVALNRHEYIVRADFEASLSAINTRKELVLDEIEQEFDRVVRKVNLEKGKKIKLERNTTYGYFFRISRLDGNVLSNNSEFQELAALKNGIHFVSTTLRESSLQYDELVQEYSKAQNVLVQEMLNVALTFRKLFGELDQVIARVDVLQSLAYAAVMSPIPLVRPIIMATTTTVVGGERELFLQDSRHPCVEATASGNTVASGSCSTSFIPNNVHFTQDSSLQIITGPNMGGKSTYIRQTAIIILMAQVGSFVPCSSAKVPIYDAILVRVGAGDSILRGISTFMMEMLETASILRTATPNSFVVIDELGRGTSTSEGLGLAWGVSKVLARRKCFTFFATHFHELTELADSEPNVKNLHANAIIDQGSLLMTFRITPGVCDQSFGVHVAQMAGFPTRVIDMAKIMLKDLEGSGFTEEQAEEGLSYFEDNPGDLANAPTFIKSILPSICIS